MNKFTIKTTSKKKEKIDNNIHIKPNDRNTKKTRYE